jgi:hypothetical protein
MLIPYAEPVPVRDPFIDGGFKAVDGKQEISNEDARILAEYINALKAWGSNGWTWITDYYIKEIESWRTKDE